jgi:hypothetical protein
MSTHAVSIEVEYGRRLLFFWTQDGSVDLAESDLEALDFEVKEDIQDATRLAGEEPVVTFDRFNELMTTVLVSK